MSYQVLARKWRPKTFESLVGQEHVVRALTHALSEQRLHHAYLFTGTRGVGKTTLARILAKSFNCEKGITATPCGVCSACTEIDSGRFVDLLEVDAATNTKVDEMRQLLENGWLIVFAMEREGEQLFRWLPGGTWKPIIPAMTGGQTSSAAAVMERKTPAEHHPQKECCLSTLC